MDFPVAQEVDTNVYRKIPSNEMHQINSSKSVVDFVRPYWVMLLHYYSGSISS